MSDSVQDHIDAYLEVLAVERRLSEHTTKAYRRDIAKLLKFCDERGLFLWKGLNNHNARLFSASLNESFRRCARPKIRKALTKNTRC